MLSGYSDTQTKKWVRWTFKEYIRDELACYLDGMLINMKRTFKFVNVSGNAYRDVTATAECMDVEHNVNCAAIKQKLPALYQGNRNWNDTRVFLLPYLVEHDRVSRQQVNNYFSFFLDIVYWFHMAKLTREGITNHCTKLPP